jgi:hypothetical protein
MSVYRKNTRPFISILLIIGIVFFMHLIITPLSLTQGQSSVGRVADARESTTARTPIRLFGKSFIVADFTGNEILTDMEIIYTINRDIRDFQRIINRLLQSLGLSIISLSILIYYILYSYKKMEQKKSVLAISIGGHAPPQSFA